MGVGACLPTFDQLAAVCGARVELQGDDMTLGLVEELDWDSDRGRHGWVGSPSGVALRGVDRVRLPVVGLEFEVGELAASQSLGWRARNLTEPEADMLWASRETGGPGNPRRCRIFRAEGRYQVAVTYCRAPKLLPLSTFMPTP